MIDRKMVYPIPEVEDDAPPVAPAAIDDDDDDDDILALLGVQADNGMTPDAIFCREYLRTGDAMTACVRAGLASSEYSLSVSAEYHLSRPEIQAALSVLAESGVKRERVVYSRELILDELQGLYEAGKQGVPVSSAISALKVQAQLLGYLDTTINVNHSVSAKDMSLSDLRAAVAARMSGENAVVIEGVSRDVSDG